MCVKNIHKDRKSIQHCQERSIGTALFYENHGFFLRFANRIIILVDAKAILYLPLCKEAAGILLYFSIAFSKYEAEVIHVKEKNNEVADVLSGQHSDINKLKEDVKQSKPMTEKQTMELLNKLKIPKKYSFTRAEVADM